MAITYHAGRRIQGTSTDFGTAGSGIPGVSGGWKELGRTTLGSAGDTISVASLEDKRYLMILQDERATGGLISSRDTINGDSGSNYARRLSSNGGADGTVAPSTFFVGHAADGENFFGVSYLSNLAAKEKLEQRWFVHQNTAGAGTAPQRYESVGKWTGSDVINRYDTINNNTGDFNTGSEVVVLGWDPADTHTSNFWEELADVSWSSGDNVTTSTFTAKKYLWVQGWVKATTSMGLKLRVGNTTLDTGSNYADRVSTNGAADFTDVSGTYCFINGGGAANRQVFVNMFIINNAANEKLMINHSVDQSTAGAGTAPNREEGVYKWSNTSNQINIISLFTNGAADLTGGSMKVWGSD